MLFRSRPRVVLQKDETSGAWLEPIEEVVIDVDEEHAGVVVQKMSERKAEMVELRPSGGNRQRLVFHAPTRGLIGYQSELLTDTRGTAVMNRLFHAYQPYKGELPGRTNGVLISNESGEAVAYAMWNLEDRGPMVIDPGVKVYQGMIIGIHSRDNDLEVNVLKGKKLTNVRASGKDEATRLTPPILMSRRSCWRSTAPAGLYRARMTSRLKSATRGSPNRFGHTSKTWARARLTGSLRNARRCLPTPIPPLSAASER